MDDQRKDGRSVKAEIKPEDERVLLLAPTAKDAAVTGAILADQNVASHVCENIVDICREAELGAGAALIAKEHLLADSSGCMAAFLRNQPPWSDFPVIVLMRSGRHSPAAVKSLTEIGNMTLLPRPVQIAGLVSTIRAALRDRRRQYAVRDFLREREQVTAKLARDVQRRKKAESQLRDSEDRFRQLANAITQLAWTAQADGYIDWYNTRWYEYTGMTQEQMQGWGWQCVHDPEVLPRVLEIWKLSLQTGEPFEMVFPLRGADGEFRPFLTRGMPFRNAEGEIVRWFGTNTDISEQKETQERLRQVAAELSEADRRKDEFLALLAHELRNPLAAISSALHLLDTPAATTNQTDSARAIAKRQTLQLQRLIDDLLDISRITRGKVQLRKERFDLVQAADRAVDAVRPLIETHHHQLTVSLTQHQELFVHGDPARIEQILVNLLTNATKYTPDGGQISLTVESEAEQHVLRVRDTGVGISAKMLPTIFELFAQAPRSLARSEGGLGIGLTLVKALVELHGGAVSVVSERGKGSEFVIRLPAVEPLEMQTAGEPVSENPDAATRRVLVVDDNRDTAQMLAMLLEFDGHSVAMAHDGLEAIQAVRNSAPDVVLLDIGLPGLNGYEVAEQIRDDGSVRQPMIIAVSGYGQSEDRRRSRAAGMDAHLVKPVDRMQLCELLAGAKV